MITMDEARRILVEQLYTASPGREPYLLDMLSMEMETLEIPVSHAECTCSAHWTAWSIQEHTEHGKHTEMRTVYIDSNEVRHEHPGYEYKRYGGRRGTSVRVPWRKTTIPHTVVGDFVIEDGRSQTEGDQMARCEEIRTPFEGRKLGDWLRLLPSSGSVEALPNVPAIEPEVLAQMQKQTETNAETLCRADIPGSRYVDFRMVSQFETTSWIECITVIRGTFEIDGTKRSAYLSALDETLFLLPQLPETSAEAKRRLEEQKISDELGKIREKWDRQIQRHKETFSGTQMKYSRQKEALERENADMSNTLSQRETAGVSKPLLCIAGVIASAILTIIAVTQMQEGFSLLWLLLFLAGAAILALLGWKLYRMLRGEQEMYAAVKADKQQMRTSMAQSLRSIEEQLAEASMQLSNDIAQCSKSCDEELRQAEEELRRQLPPAPAPDEAVLAILRDATLSPLEQMDRLRMHLPGSGMLL